MLYVDAKQAGVDLTRFALHVCGVTEVLIVWDTF